MSQLSDYVKTQLSAGYTSEQIQTLLLQQGYNQEQINQSFAEANRVQSKTQTKQVNSQDLYQQLYTYVYQTLSSGYPAEQLYPYLIQQGYDSKTVDKVFRQLHSQYNTQVPNNVIHQHDVSSSSIMKVGVMVLVVALFIGGFFFFMQNAISPDHSVKLLQVQLSLFDDVVKPNDELKFEVNSINEGDPGLVDVQFKYIITDARDRIVDDWMESRAFQTRMQFVTSFDIPFDLPEGKYKLTVNTYYGNQKSSPAYRNFRVVETVEQQQEAEEVEQPEDIEEVIDASGNDDSLTDTSDNPQDTSSSVVQPSIGKVDSSSQSDDSLLLSALSSESSEEAAGYCQAIESQFMQEQCYTSIAEFYQDSSYCSLITTQDQAENCYMNFLIMGDSSVCEFITLPQNAVLCDEFKHLEDIQNYFDTGDVSILEESSGISISSHNESEIPDNYVPALNEMSISDLV